jgi:hypothetical protein
LAETFGIEKLLVDGKAWNRKPVDPLKLHSIEISIGTADGRMPAKTIRKWVREIVALGAGSVLLRGPEGPETLAVTQRCSVCGSGFKELSASHFNQFCLCVKESERKQKQAGLRLRLTSRNF